MSKSHPFWTTALNFKVTWTQEERHLTVALREGFLALPQSIGNRLVATPTEAEFQNEVALNLPQPQT